MPDLALVLLVFIPWAAIFAVMLWWCVRGKP